MHNKNKGLRIEGKKFLVLLCIYIILGVLLQTYHRYEGLNSNTIGYFTVALEYARGNFNIAVNGFFSPLISWMLVPFIKTGMDPLLSARILNLAAGLFLLVGVKTMADRFELSDKIRNVILLSMVPITLSYTKLIFADLFTLCLLVFYFNIVFSSEYADSPFDGIICGLLGALTYFSKSYAFPFFLAHFFLLNILHFLKKTSKTDRKKILLNTVAGIVVFSILSGVWISLMSSKYNYFTIGTAGNYLIRLVGPDVKGVPDFRGPQENDPVYYAGLFKPPYESAISVWDEPTYIAEKYSSNRKLWSEPKYLLKHVARNTNMIIQKILVKSFSFLSISIIIAYLLFCLQPLRSLLQRGDILYPLITLALYTTGYTPTIIHLDNIRYFWVDNLLLLFMGGQVVTVLFGSEFFKGKFRQYLLVGILALSFIVTPVKDIFSKSTRGEENLLLSKKLTSQYNIKGNIASNDKWGYSLELAYNMNLIRPENKIFYYGMPVKNRSSEELLNELGSNDIDYYIVWGDDSFSQTRKSREITGGSIMGFRIYYFDYN